MAFRHPIRNEFDRIFRELDKRSSLRSIDGVIARAQIKLLRPFVEQLENERNADTPGHHFLHAMIAVLANVLAATLKFTVDHGEQRAALKVILGQLGEQIEGRLDQPPQSAVLLSGLDNKAARHGVVSLAGSGPGA